MNGRRWVLCDGASESWDAAHWAVSLATALAEGDDLQVAVGRARRRFAHADGRTERHWYVDRARERGSWAAALVVEASGGGKRIEAHASGDVELFVLDGTSLVAAFPIERAADFGSTPDLIGAGTEPSAAFRSARFELGALRRPNLLMATDALAARILGCGEEERRGLLRFLSRCPAPVFAAWAAAETAVRSLAVDDLTLLWIR